MGEGSRKVPPRREGLRLLLKGALLTSLGCGGGDVQEPNTGGISISTTTSGPEADPDGYTIRIDEGAETPITINATMDHGDVEPGNHMVHLSGLSSNCIVGGENPRAVTVSAGQSATVSFEVTCSATIGSLQVTSTTSGSSPDPDGYLVTLDGSDRGPLGVSGAMTLDGLTSGSHSVGLSGVAANCSVEGDNPRAVTVNPGSSSTTAFSIVCAAPEPGAGSLRITTVTTGPEADVDGYTFALDGGTGQPIGASATAILANVPPGAHQVRLSGAAVNCSLQGANPRRVTVGSGATAEASFAITCVATGSLTVRTITTGSTRDPDGYTLAIDRAAAQPIGTDTTLVTRLLPGTHVVTLAGLTSNCYVQEANPATVTIVQSGAAEIAFNISCTPPALTHWTRMLTGTTKTLVEISGSSPSDIFVVDDEGGIMHYDGLMWNQQTIPLEASHVWANSPTEVYATATTSDSLPVLLSYAGQQWSVALTPSVPAELEGHAFYWTAIWGSGHEVFAVGNWKAREGDTLSAPGYIVHYDGTSWNSEFRQWESSAGGRLSDVWGTSTQDVYLIGSEEDGDPVGFVLRKTAGGWETTLRGGLSFFDHIGGTSSSNIYVTATPTDRNVEYLWHFDGVSWDGDPYFSSYYEGVWGINDRVYFWRGRSVYGPGGRMYFGHTGDAVGDMWGSSATDVYVVGSRGWIMHGTP